MNRKTYSSSLKAKIALEALKEEKTLAELSSIYGVHSNQISKWKKQLKEGMSEIFQKKGSTSKKDGNDEDLKARLYQEIGQLKVELDWLKKKVL